MAETAQTQEVAWPADIARAAGKAGIPLQAISIVVQSPRNEMLLALNAETPRKTGSVMKLLPTLVALQQLGPQFKFHTDLLANPESGRPQHWNVAIRGGGDSGFQYADLINLLSEAKKQGVRSIYAPIIADRRRFGDDKGKMSGINLSIGSVSGILPDALSVGFSAIELKLPAQHQDPIQIDPPFKLLLKTDREVNHTQICPKGWDEGLSLVPQSSEKTKQEKLSLEGQWPKECPEVMIRRAPLSPQDLWAWSMRLALKQLGYAKLPEVIEGQAPSYAKVSIRYFSRPMASLVRDINKYSNNMAARTLLLNLAAESGFIPANTESGVQVIQQWLKSRGLIFPELVIENGSGLSHREVITPSHLAAFLKVSTNEPVFPYYLDSLPIPGELGTMQKRFLGRPDRLQWHLKTGRLDGVRTLAGFHVNRSGSLTTVVCMIEHENLDQVQVLQEALLNWVAFKEVEGN